MDPVVVILRLIHIGCGVFWAGTILFVAFFLEPSVRAAGPEGGKVMQMLAQRNFLNILPAIALLTILSGAWLYWRTSGHFQPGFMRSPYGMTLGIGAAAAIVGFVIGFFVMRDATIRAGKLGATMAQMTDGADKQQVAERVNALRGLARTSLRWVAAFLIVAVTAMAVARYVS